jgi:hypothetical protein
MRWIWRAPMAIFNGASMAQNNSAPLKDAPRSPSR